MKNTKVFSLQRTSACMIGLLVACPTGVYADNFSDASGLMEATGYTPNELSFFKNNNLIAISIMNDIP